MYRVHCEHLLDCVASMFLQFISASQPITALAYIFDGLHYGISDFMFAACSMVTFSSQYSSEIRVCCAT